MVYELGLAHRYVGRVGRTTVFEVMLRVRYRAPRVRNPETSAAPLARGESCTQRAIWFQHGAVANSHRPRFVGVGARLTLAVLSDIRGRPTPTTRASALTACFCCWLSFQKVGVFLERHVFSV